MTAAGAQGFAAIPRSMLYDADVPRDAKLAYLVISSHVGGNATAWPSHQRIGELAGFSKSTSKRMVAWLVDHGYLEVTPRHDPGNAGSNLSNEYRLIVGSVSYYASTPGVTQTPPPGVTQTLGSDGHQGGVTQPPGVGSHRTPNDSQLTKVTERESFSGRAASARPHDGDNASRSDSTRGHRLPPDWRPSVADVSWQRDQGVSDEFARVETEKFRDFWLSKPGSGGRKLDWSRTWKNWIRTATERRGGTHALDPVSTERRPTW